MDETRETLKDEAGEDKQEGENEGDEPQLQVEDLKKWGFYVNFYYLFKLLII